MHHSAIVRRCVSHAAALTLLLGAMRVGHTQTNGTSIKFLVGKPAPYSFNDFYKFSTQTQLADNFYDTPQSAISAEWRLTGPGGYLSYKADGSGSSMTISLHSEFDTKQAGFTGNYLVNESIAEHNLLVFLPYQGDHPHATVSIALDLDVESTNRFVPNNADDKGKGVGGSNFQHLWGIDLDDPISFGPGIPDNPPAKKGKLHTTITANLVSWQVDPQPGDAGSLRVISSTTIKDESGHEVRYHVFNILDVLHGWDEQNKGAIQTDPPQDRYLAGDGPNVALRVDAGPNAPVTNMADGTAVITITVPNSVAFAKAPSPVKHAPSMLPPHNTTPIVSMPASPSPKDKLNLTISSLDMIGPHTLRVNLRGNFGGQTLPVHISLSINGKKLALDQQLSVNPVSSVDVDLIENRIPRFKQSTVISARVILRSGLSASSGMILPLPIIFVPGITPAYTSSKPFSGVIRDIMRDKPSSIRLRDYDFSVNSTVPGYYNLYTLVYDRNKSTFVEGANDLSREIDLIYNSTYAEYVNIVAHSKGCLVTRAFLSSNTSNTKRVKNAYLVQGPNMGSFFTTGMKFLQPLSSKYKYANLMPVYTWLGTKQGYVIPESHKNVELNDLNNRLLYPGCHYVIISNSRYGTLTLGISTGPNGIPIPEVGMGDRIVPDFSQRGETVEVNMDGSVHIIGKIRPFADLLSRGVLSYQIIPDDHVTAESSTELADYIRLNLL